jgi:hypothetical protein
MNGHNSCVTMRLTQTDQEKLEKEKERTNATTSFVLSSAIERGYDLTTNDSKTKGAKINED